jgi:hypothetical protein
MNTAKILHLSIILTGKNMLKIYNEMTFINFDITH